MKNILLLLLLFPLLSIGQIPKGATKIIVKNDLTAKDNFNLAIKTLMDNDYFIEKQDSELLTIKTEAKRIKGSTGPHYYHLRIVDNTIQISGLWKSGLEMGIFGTSTTDSYETIANKSGLYRPVFNNMDAMASKFPGSKTYQ